MESGTKRLKDCPRSLEGRRGAALVIVLGFLVLIMVVVVAFLTSVKTEYSTATNAAAGSTSRELADASVQLVIGQIREATSLGTNVAWASQPGMIRDYGTGTAGNYAAASDPLAYYKLYSSDNMVVDKNLDSYDPKTDVLANWNDLPALFTDLNAPISAPASSINTAGTKNYPIIDPTASDTPAGKKGSLVDGFSIASDAPVATVTDPNKAPMPVRWIYVLRDGTLTAPTASSAQGTVADFSSYADNNPKKPTIDNPIVGRIAFWTDDETCKINLNTACGGTYWDNPMFSNAMEQNFSRYKPVVNEFSRYPGHPATTSLLPVLWSFTSMHTPYDNLFPAITPYIKDSNYTLAGKIDAALAPAAATIWSNLLDFVPRNQWGGSQMASVPTSGDLSTANPVAGQPPIDHDAPTIKPDSDRLYSSVDEALFGHYSDADPSKPRPANAFNISNDNLKKLRFFLTTSSRAPETNPFNQPKIGIWPVPELPAKRSAVDSLIAFCSTLKPSTVISATTNYAYFFTRNNYDSSTADFTTRNSALFDYLDKYFDLRVPGFGQKISNRYGVTGDRRILTVIYDFIRSTINLEDTQFGKDAAGLYKNTFSVPDGSIPGYGQVTPIKITKEGVDYRGIGRFPVISQATIVFIAQAANNPPLVCAPNGRPLVYDENDNPISDSTTGYLSDAAALDKVANGLAHAKMNQKHLWLKGTGSGNVPQFLDTSSHPILAVDGAESTDYKKYFPIFGTATADAVTGGSVSSIADEYPTFYATDTKEGRYGILQSGSTQTVSGKTCVIAALPTPGVLKNPGQTHAGMPFLTVQDPVKGAFSLKNPRYQGPTGTYPDPDTLTKNSGMLANLNQGETQMQAVILLDPVDLASGRVPLAPRYQVEISGLNTFAADSIDLGFPASAVQSNGSRPPTPFYYLGMDTISGGYGPDYLPRRFDGLDSNKLNWVGRPSITVPLVVKNPTFQFTGGTLTVKIYAAAPNTVPGNSSRISLTTDPTRLVQTYQIKFPSTTFPTPLLPHMPALFQGSQGANQLIADKKSAGAGYQRSNYYTPDYNPDYASDDTHFHTIWPSRVADLVPSNLLTVDPGSRLATKSVAGTGGVGGPNYGVGSTGLFRVKYLGPNPYPAIDTDASYIDGAGVDTGYNKYRSRFYYDTGGSNDGCRTTYFLPERNGNPENNDLVKKTCDTIRSVECVYGDPRIYASMTSVPVDYFVPHRYYYDQNMRAAHTLRAAIPNAYPGGFSGSSSLYRGATEHYLSDACLKASAPYWDYNYLFTGSAPYSGAHYTGDRKSAPLNGPNPLDRMAGENSSKAVQNGITSGSPTVTSSAEFDTSVFSANVSWTGLTPFADVWKQGGDFSNGTGSEPDGPFINKPNESGGTLHDESLGGTGIYNFYPEWWLYVYTASLNNKAQVMPEQFSPNRMISSPVAFGSLPSGYKPEDAWKTLLFCPNPNVSKASDWAGRMTSAEMTPAGQKISGAKAPDHLILDFFTMPVVEPYAISEPFSTAGKVNMNYQIAPFTYIERSTALRGVLASTMITAVDDQWVSSLDPVALGDSNYKSNSTSAVQAYGGSAFARVSDTDPFGKFLRDSSQWGFRYPIHAGETLKQFTQRFKNGDLFHSPSEICSLFLYPAKQPPRSGLNPDDPAPAIKTWDQDNANILAWWYTNKSTNELTRKSLTGDNMRERPYDSIYPRLTTKSNSYTVHFRVQVLKKVGGSNAAQWTEQRDQVISEFRGSSLIERYIDPSDPNLPDFALPANTETLDKYYKFRVVSTKKFTAE